MANELTLTLPTTLRLPAATSLSENLVVLQVVSTLRRDVTPCIWSWVETQRRANDELQKLAAAQQIGTLPPEIAGYPVAFRAMVSAPPDFDEIADLVAMTVDGLPGYRPASMPLYLGSVVDALLRGGFGPKIVCLSCRSIREHDSGKFKNSLPWPADFIGECEQAKTDLAALADVIDCGIRTCAWARHICARKTEIEANARQAAEDTQRRRLRHQSGAKVVIAAAVQARVETQQSQLQRDFQSGALEAARKSALDRLLESNCEFDRIEYDRANALLTLARKRFAAGVCDPLLARYRNRVGG